MFGGSYNLENPNPFNDGLGPRRVRQRRASPDSPDPGAISKSRMQESETNAIANSSRDGASMFQSASNVDIFGGSFLTVTVNANLRKDVNEPQVDSGSVSINDESDEGVYHPETIQKGKGKGKEKRGVKRPAAELSFDSESDATTSTSTQPSPIRRSCEIYYQHIGVKRRGSPLWIPEPNKRLHLSYQRKGIAIGDVGIITDSGSFDFLFNICLPRDHPINAEQLQDDFVPFSIRPTDVRQYSEFKGNSYLASGSVKKSRRGGNSSLNFEASASEGALLAMPVGLNSEDLRNIPAIRRYAAANAEYWYRWIINIIGCPIENGDVRLVIGYDKTVAWGIATFSDLTAQQDSFQLNFRPVEPSKIAKIYEWEHSGMAEVRAGPDARDIQALRDGDPEQEGEEYENQCLFVRTLNIKLRDKIWKKIESEVGAVEVDEDPGYSTYSDSMFLGGSSPSVSSSQSSSSTSSASPPRYSGGQSRHLPAALAGHPSGGINEMLLKLHPNARAAITEDQDWISVIKEDDFILPPPGEIYARIMKSFIVREAGDIVFLEKIEEPVHHSPRVTETEQLQRFRDALNLPMDGAGPLVFQQMYKPGDPQPYSEETQLEVPLYFISSGGSQQLGLPVPVAAPALAETAHSVASSSTSGVKRPRDEDSGVGSSSSSVTNEPSRLKRAKTEWERISEELETFLNGYGSVPESEEGGAGGLRMDGGGESSGIKREVSLPPPPSPFAMADFDDFFDFSFGPVGDRYSNSRAPTSLYDFTFGDEDNNWGAPTPDLVSSLSSANTTPQQSLDSEVLLNSPSSSSGDLHTKMEEASDPLRFSWTDIDGGDGPFYQKNGPGGNW